MWACQDCKYYPKQPGPNVQVAPNISFFRPLASQLQIPILIPNVGFWFWDRFWSFFEGLQLESAQWLAIVGLLGALGAAIISDAIGRLHGLGRWLGGV